jgi:hypothetical protein
VKTNSGFLSWQSAGYFEIIAINAPASSKTRTSAMGQLLPIISFTLVRAGTGATVQYYRITPYEALEMPGLIDV